MPTPPRAVSPVRLRAAVAGLSAALFLPALPAVPAAAADIAEGAGATGTADMTGVAELAGATGAAGTAASADSAASPSGSAASPGSAGATGSAVPFGVGLGGYTDPAFADACTFHRYGEGETPPLGLIGTDPVCVEYAKRDITVSNGGALRFLLAEPARFALAVPACRYWQIDHWSVQTHPGGPALVGWDGSYWFDQSSGEAALKARNIKVAGAPATGEEAADALRPYDPALADALLRASLGVKVELPLSPSCSWRTR